MIGCVEIAFLPNCLEVMAHVQQSIWIGRLLIGASRLGMGLSVIGALVLLVLVSRIEGAVARNLNTTEQALTNITASLTLAQTSLERADATLLALRGTVNNTGAAMRNTELTLDTISEVLGTDLPETLRSTQQALAAAQQSANLVDGMLGALNNLPLVGTVYNPEVPLGVAIGRISTSLAQLPPEIAQVRSGVIGARNSLTQLADDSQKIETELAAMSSNIQDARTITGTYQELVTAAQTEIRLLRDELPWWLWVARIGGVVLSIWFGIAQLGLLTYGRDLVART